MFNILQGETIPMACSSFFLYQLNNQPLEGNNNNYLSSKLFQLGTLFKDRKRNTLSSQDAETTQLRNKPENGIFVNEKKKKSNSQRKCRITEKTKSKCLNERLIIQTK
jgi:hypothetical protein